VWSRIREKTAISKCVGDPAAQVNLRLHSPDVFNASWWMAGRLFENEFATRPFPYAAWPVA